MKYNRLANPDPFVDKPARSSRAVVAGSNDHYGACSIEDFSSASGLTYTHEDAQGFLDFPTSFPGNGANFWFRDNGVKVWGYEEAYDNWQDTYGMDSVVVFYHSGHGNMDRNGVFEAPLGASWDGRDWAFSNRMAFANEELRYLFWSTCFSLRVSGPDDPVRTWWAPNRGGLRMLFGYETTSVDDPNYGKFFWEEWRKGKTFARAFLDASWRISHSQVPVVMASGANQAEAIGRLSSERNFTRTPAAKGWYQWQWIGTLPSRRFAYRTSVPKGMRSLVLENRYQEDERLARIAGKVGIPRREARTIRFDEHGNRLIGSKAVRLHVSREGALSLQCGSPNMENQSALAEGKAIRAANAFIEDLGLDKDIEVKLGNIRHRFTSGGKPDGGVGKPAIVETIVQFRQFHRGVESVNSDHGLIAVSIDNDQTVTNVYDTTRRILGETDKPRSVIASPPERKRGARGGVEAWFRGRIQRITNANAKHKGKSARQRSTVIQDKVGYDFSGNLGHVVHQKIVELTVDRQFKKRYKIRVPVMG